MLRSGVTTNTRLQWYSGVLYFLINTSSTVEDVKAFCFWPINTSVAMTLHSRFGKLRPNVYLEIYNTNSAKYLARFVSSVTEVRHLLMIVLVN